MLSKQEAAVAHIGDCGLPIHLRPLFYWLSVCDLDSWSQRFKVKGFSLSFFMSIYDVEEHALKHGKFSDISLLALVMHS